MKFLLAHFFAAITFSGNQLESVTEERISYQDFQEFSTFCGDIFFKAKNHFLVNFSWKIMVVHDHPSRRPYGGCAPFPKANLRPREKTTTPIQEILRLGTAEGVEGDRLGGLWR